MKGIPVPKKRWPILGHVPIFAAHKGNLKNALQAMHDECGPNYYVLLPNGKSMLITADAELTRRILLNQGAEAVRADNWHWVKVFRDQGWPMDISNERGPKWHAYRKVFNQTVANRQNSLEFIPAIDEKTARLVRSIRAHLDTSNPDSEGFYRVRQETLFRRILGMTALEASTHIFLGKKAPFIPGVDDASFEQDFVLTKQQADEVASAMEDMFNATEKVDSHPFVVYWPKAFKVYRDLEKAWKTSIELPMKMIQQSLDEYNKTGKWPDIASDTSLFPMLLKQEGITQRECVFLGVEASIATIDTTATSSEFAICHLARAPEIQRQLREEILASEGTSFATRNADTGKVEIDHHAYDDARKLLRACVRESMRLTPTIGYHVRKLTRDIKYTCPETGTEIFLPQGLLTMVNYTKMALDPKYVHGSKAASEFDPTRFLRIHDRSGSSTNNNNNNNNNTLQNKNNNCPQQHLQGQSEDKSEKKKLPQQCPFTGGLAVHSHAAAIPFGVGSRRCAGGGLAQIFVETVIRDVLKNFECKWTGPEIACEHRGLHRMTVVANEHLWLKPIDSTCNTLKK